MPTTFTFENDNRRIAAAVGAGETSPPIYVDRARDCVITVNPGGSGTMLAEASWSTKSAIAAGNASWFPWDAGTVSAKTLQMLLLATAVRFTATTAAGVGEVAL